VRGVFASLLAAVILNILPASPASAAECVLVPDSQPPAGMRWYLRTDPVKQRKCWSMGPIAKANQAASAQGQLAPPPVRAMAQPSPLKPIVSQRTMVRSLYGGEPQGGRAMTAPQSGAIAGTRSRASAQDSGFGRWPDAQQPAATDAEGGALNTADTQQSGTTDAQDESPMQQAVGADDADQSSDSSMQPIKLIALLAGALAIAGLAGRAIVKASAGRWRRTIVARGVDWGANLLHEDPVLPMMASPPAADLGSAEWRSGGASLPREPSPSAFDHASAAPPAADREHEVAPGLDAKDHVPTPEERLREILRAWEPRAA
jgi:hypothetical protein